MILIVSSQHWPIVTSELELDGDLPYTDTTVSSWLDGVSGHVVDMSSTTGITGPSDIFAEIVHILHEVESKRSQF